MAELPSEEEVWDSVGKLKIGKAGGASGILPEIVKAASCEDAFMSALMMMCRVPGNWRDAIILAAVTTGVTFRC